MRGSDADALMEPARTSIIKAATYIILDTRLLAIARVPVAIGVGFLSADECAVLRASVPTHAFLVIDAAVRIEPHDDIRRAVRLGRRLGIELLHLAGGSCRCG